MNKENKALDVFEIFPWNENFEMGIKELDEQHKSLVSLLNELAKDLTQDKSIEVEKTFKKLAEYAEYHFKYEEKVWQKYIGDDDLNIAHKYSHENFLPKIEEIKNKNKDKEFNDVIEEILLFLIRWLAFHIIDEDKRLAYIIKALKEGKNLSEAKYLADEIMSGSMKNLIDTIILMYDDLSLKAINLIRERKKRLKAEEELKKINIELEKLSITDQLTKLYNRRYFDVILNRELDKAKRNKTTLSLMILDIDLFKKLNDTFGHLHGDKVLVEVAKCIKTVCKRANDLPFRIGGEEFAIIITNEEPDSLIFLSKIVQDEISKLKIKTTHEDENSYLTISAGVVSKVPEKDDFTDQFIKMADERLYKAKNMGRNRIIYN